MREALDMFGHTTRKTKQHIITNTPQTGQHHWICLECKDRALAVCNLLVNCKLFYMPRYSTDKCEAVCQAAKSSPKLGGSEDPGDGSKSLME